MSAIAQKDMLFRLELLMKTCFDSLYRKNEGCPECPCGQCGRETRAIRRAIERKRKRRPRRPDPPDRELVEAVLAAEREEKNS